MTTARTPGASAGDPALATAPRSTPLALSPRPAPEVHVTAAQVDAPPATATPAPPEAAGQEASVAGTTPAVRTFTGPLHRRRLSRRRRIIEETVVVLIFLVALGVTVLLLAGQWLLNASVTGTLQ